MLPASMAPAQSQTEDYLSFTLSSESG